LPEKHGHDQAMFQEHLCISQCMGLLCYLEDIYDNGLLTQRWNGRR
jgi:hypothetical protein